MYFSNNPIIISISDISFPANSTNHRIELHVTFNQGTNQERTHIFPQHAEQGEDVEIDISSAFRAELQMYDPTPNLYATSPQVTASISAISRYLDLETITEGQFPATASESSVTARRGGVSDSDLYFQNYVIGDAESVPLTTKPAPVSDASPSGISPELVSPGSILQFGNTKYTVPASSKHGDLLPRSSVYGEGAQGFFQVDTSAHRYEFFFLNSRGEIETIQFSSFQTLQQQIKRESLALATVSNVSPLGSPTIKAYTTSSRASLKCSTGFLSEEWLSWVVSDFLTSEHHWLLTSQGLLPVIISFDENITVRNLAGNDITAIAFTATSAISGPLRL